mgnify:CR=1 FL=1
MRPWRAAMRRTSAAGLTSPPGTPVAYELRGGSTSCHAWSRRLRLLQPVRHAHVAVHRRRRRDVLLRLLALARAPRRACRGRGGSGRRWAASRAPRRARAPHGSGHQLARGIAAGGDVAEEPQGRRLVAASTALAGEGQERARACERVLQPVGERVRLAQIQQEEWLHEAVPHRLTGAQRLLQQWDALGNPPRARRHGPAAPCCCLKRWSCSTRESAPAGVRASGWRCRSLPW